MGRLQGGVSGVRKDQGLTHAELRPGRAGVPVGAESVDLCGPGRQDRDARVSFHVVDGRMACAAFAGSGW
ncbi:hypothetical protein GCM10010270_11530 [Streptomyces violaceus]|nr:hypothetical protein GCM10010270_11530 [Streptomyces janthinus]